MNYLLRTYLIVCSSLLFFNSVHSQSYLPMLEDGKEWTIVHYCYAFVCGPLYTQAYHIYLDGDSIIGNQVYKRATAEYRNSINPWGQPFTYGWFREDTLTGQVFRLMSCSEMDSTVTEQLLFDFSLNVGDTMSNCSDSTIICTGVQTITTSDGKQRREITVIHDFYGATPKKMIEGIGGEYYNWELQPLGFVDTTFIDCVAKDNINIYGNCAVVTDIPELETHLVSTFSSGEAQIFEFPPYRKARTLQVYRNNFV